MFWFVYPVSSVTKVGDWQTEKAKQARKIYAIVCVSRKENSRYFNYGLGGYVHFLCLTGIKAE
jgi:hypothetical protein